MIDFGLGVSLAAINPDDSALLLKWRNDPSIWRTCRQYTSLEYGSHREWFEGLAKRPDVKMWGIYQGQKILGVCGITSIDRQNRRAEFSLYVGPKEQGNGYGEAALKTLLCHAFYHWGLHTVWGETYNFNPAARMFERVGMTKDGVHREAYFREGVFVDAILYSMTETEWKSCVGSWGASWQGRRVEWPVETSGASSRARSRAGLPGVVYAPTTETTDGLLSPV